MFYKHGSFHFTCYYAVVNIGLVIRISIATGILAIALFVIDTFRKLSKEKNIAIVFSTHDLEIANKADRIVHLVGGKCLS